MLKFCFQKQLTCNANITHLAQVHRVLRAGSTKSQLPSSLFVFSEPTQKHCCHVRSGSIWEAVGSRDMLLMCSTDTV